MNELYLPPLKESKSRRKQLGRVLFWIGIIIVMVSIYTTISLSFLQPSASEYPGNMTLGIGIIFTIFGLIAALFPGGQGEDETWIMMLSPFAGNN